MAIALNIFRLEIFKNGHDICIRPSEVYVFECLIGRKTHLWIFAYQLAVNQKFPCAALHCEGNVWLRLQENNPFCFWPFLNVTKIYRDTFLPYSHYKLIFGNLYDKKNIFSSIFRINFRAECRKLYMCVVELEASVITVKSTHDFLVNIFHISLLAMCTRMHSYLSIRSKMLFYCSLFLANLLYLR